MISEDLWVLEWHKLKNLCWKHCETLFIVFGGVNIEIADT